MQDNDTKSLCLTTLPGHDCSLDPKEYRTESKDNQVILYGGTEMLGKGESCKARGEDGNLVENRNE